MEKHLYQLYQSVEGMHELYQVRFVVGVTVALVQLLSWTIAR